MTRVGRTAAGAAIALVVASGMAAVPAAPAGAQAAEPYAADASVDLVHVDVGDIVDVIDVADVSVSPATAATDTAGLDDFGGANAAGTATNLDVSLLSDAIPLEALVAVDDLAPPDDGPTTETLLELPDNPLLNATVASASAQSRWRGAGECVPSGTPISEAQVDVASAQVLPGAVGDALVALENDEGPTVFTRSTVGLVDVDGRTGKGVQAEALTQVTAVRLFAGTDNEITINVVAPPRVTAVATGDPDTSFVEYTEPVLQVYQGDTLLGELNAADADLTIPGAPVVELELGTLDSTVAPDGTSAEGQADLLRVSVAAVPDVLTLFQLSVAGASVRAEAPVGGVACGDKDNFLREVHKDLSADTAVPGQPFTYSVVIPNRGDCALHDVAVTDVITGGDATITGTNPAGTIGEDGQSVSWVIDSLEPNETKVFDITVVADAGPGTTYLDTLLATGTDCDGDQHEGGDELSGPTVGGTGANECDVSASNIAADHEKVVVGETFTYFVHLANSGGQACEDIAVTQDLDENVTFVDCNLDCTHPDHGTPNGEVTWTVPALGPGESKTLWVVAEVLDTAADGDHLPSTVDIAPANGDSHQASTPGPLVTGTSVLAAAMPARFVGVLAATGFDARLVLLVLLGSLALLVRRRRIPAPLPPGAPSTPAG